MRNISSLIKRNKGLIVIMLIVIIGSFYLSDVIERSENREVTLDKFLCDNEYTKEQINIIDGHKYTFRDRIEVTNDRIEKKGRKYSKYGIEIKASLESAERDVLNIIAYEFNGIGYKSDSLIAKYRELVHKALDSNTRECEYRGIKFKVDATEIIISGHAVTYME